MKTYQALLVAPDGDYVTDYEAPTIRDVEEILANQGSRWYFYPYEFVILREGSKTDILNRKIRSTTDEFQYLKGMSVRKVISELKEV